MLAFHLSPRLMRQRDRLLRLLGCCSDLEIDRVRRQIPLFPTKLGGGRPMNGRIQEISWKQVCRQAVYRRLCCANCDAPSKRPTSLNRFPKQDYRFRQECTVRAYQFSFPSLLSGGLSSSVDSLSGFCG